MSGNRRQFDIQSWPGGVWNSPERPLMRYVELEVLSAAAGVVVIRWSGIIPTAGATVSQYEGYAPQGCRIAWDTGGVDHRMVSLADGQYGGFTARVRTDVEPIGSHPQAVPVVSSALGSYVPVLLTGPGAGSGAPAYVEVIDRAARQLGVVTQAGGPPLFASANNASATVTLFANPGLAWHISALSFAFTAAPAGVPTAAVQQGAANLWATTVPSTTPVHASFPNGGMLLPVGTAATVILLTGGPGVTGTVSVVAELR